MDKNRYKKVVDKHTPKEESFKNGIIAFLVGGSLGALGELLLRCYMVWLDLPVKAALIIPITGFAHSMTSAALEYKHEGLVLGIGSNVFKLAGTVILYGVVSVYIFGLIRLLVMGG